MADGNNADDPKSSNDPSSDHGAGGSGSTKSSNDPDLGNAVRLGSMESDSADNPPQADRYMSIGNGGREGGKSHDLPNLHGSGGGGGRNGSGYPHGSCNGFTNLHGTGGGGGGSSSSGSGYPHGYCNGFTNVQETGGGSGSSSSGSAYPQGLGNGFTNLHGSGGGGGSSSSGYPPQILGNGYGSGHPGGFGNGYGNLHWSGGGSSSETMVPFSPNYGDPDGPYLSGGGSGAIRQRSPANVFNNLYNNCYGGARVLPPMNNSYAARPPQRPGSEEYALISERLGSLTIGNSTVAEFRNQWQQQDRRTAGEQRNMVPAKVRGVYTGNNRPYWRMSLEDVKGRVSRVARNLHGCQFLCRMVKERREDVVRYVFDEVAGEIVRLMGHGIGAEFVDVMVRLWTDQQVTRVIQALAAASPWEVMAAARNQSGSNVLQNLISRIEGRQEEIECFIRGLASVGEHNLLALINDQAGNSVIQKCLETFSPEHNLFIVGVVISYPYDVAYNKHGCHTMTRCIDNSIDVHTRDFLVLAVCVEGLGLAQNQFGNYVVQHVIRAVPGVPWAMKTLHAQFQRMYVSLSRQKASSNVVQACLAFFPQQFSNEIVWELLSDPRFPELIEDPFANYVLQSAVSTTKGPLLGLLEDAVRPYRTVLRGSMHARKLLQMLFPSKSQQFF